MIIYLPDLKVYQTPPFVTFNGYSLGDTLNPTVKGKSSKTPVAAIAASVAGVFVLVVILAIFFVVRKKKTKTNAGTFLLLMKKMKTYSIHFTYYCMI